MKRRVVISGLGIVSAAGLNVAQNWERVLAGKTAIELIRGIDSTFLPCRMGGEVKGLKPRSFLKNPKIMRFLRPDVIFGLAAASQALADAGIELESEDLTRAGLFVGSGETATHYDDFFQGVRNARTSDGRLDMRRYTVSGLKSLYPSFILVDLPNNSLGYLSIETGIDGVNNNFGQANSGASAIGAAFRAVAEGDADWALAGGHDSFLQCFENYFIYEPAGLFSSSMDPDGPVHPFSAGRSGFVPAEGAGFVVLEASERAFQRKASVYAAVEGYASTCDVAGGLFDIDPDGVAYARALGAALDEASIDPAELGFILADGRASHAADIAETRGIRRAINEVAVDLPISGVKGVMGHTGSAAAAIDFCLTAMALKTGTVPPLAGYRGGDPQCNLFHPETSLPLKGRVGASINRSIMGGQICAFVLASA
jgi:3-oxoacyl-[acyl-carrier-protein] synthase II